MEAVGAVKLDLETWKKNSAVDLHVLNRCLCRRSGGGEYLLKSTVAYQHRRGVDDAAGNFCRSNRNLMDEPRHGFPLHSARQEAPPPHLNGTIASNHEIHDTVLFGVQSLEKVERLRYGPRLSPRWGLARHQRSKRAYESKSS